MVRPIGEDLDLGEAGGEQVVHRLVVDALAHDVVVGDLPGDRSGYAPRIRLRMVAMPPRTSPRATRQAR